MKQNAIKPGDVVVAIRDGGYDRSGFPLVRPMAGKTYRIESIYRMTYGLGCTLRGLDATPYKGYLLFVKSGHRFAPAGWYFRPIDVAQPEWTQGLRDYLGSKDFEPVRDQQRPASGGKTSR